MNWNKWRRLEVGKTVRVSSGLLHVQGVGSLVLEVVDQDGELVELFGQDRIKSRYDGDIEVTLISEGLAMIFDPPAIVVIDDEPIWTNADRMPMESGTLLEVAAAVRAFKLEQRQALIEARRENAKMKAERAKRREEAESAADPEPEPEPESKPEAKV